MSHKKHVLCWRVHSAWKHFVSSLLPPLVWPCSRRGRRLLSSSGEQWKALADVSAHVAAGSSTAAEGGTGVCWEPLCVTTRLPPRLTANTSHATLHRAPHPLFEMKHCSHLLNWSHRGAESGKVIGQSICQWQVSITPARIMQSARAVLLNK